MTAFDAGPCNTCRPGVALCLAPLAPFASLQAGVCKKTLARCTAPTTAMCGPRGTFGVGSQPYGAAFDGTNMWVTNGDGNEVNELSPTGTVVGTWPVASLPAGIAFDGTHMWVVTTGGTVTEL